MSDQMFCSSNVGSLNKNLNIKVKTTGHCTMVVMLTDAANLCVTAVLCITLLTSTSRKAKPERGSRLCNQI